MKLKEKNEKRYITFDPVKNAWTISPDFPKPTETKVYQEIIYQCLNRHFPGEVRKEWSVSAGATDAFRHRSIYAPRLDLAVGPFNTKIENLPETHSKISIYGFVHPFVQRLIAKEQNLQTNKNPRCRLAIEMSFSGSSKHILGDCTNASMMGLIGIVIAGRKTYHKVSRILNYARLIREVGKAPADLFNNLVVFSLDDFLRFCPYK